MHLEDPSVNVATVLSAGTTTLRKYLPAEQLPAEVHSMSKLVLEDILTHRNKDCTSQGLRKCYHGRTRNVLPDGDVPTGTAVITFAQTLGGAIFISVGQNIRSIRHSLSLS
jgi:hypothetical protein